ncbi:MAG TPA: lipoyl(octanoyl) transferase LipB [Nitrospira sp.]|jgi:lipoyl(octanoyl) transferase|nr:lipoyl(octanoyl) transferase LipB [Nitrospira sp.]
MRAAEAAAAQLPSGVPPSRSLSKWAGELVIFQNPVRYSVAWTLQLQCHAERLSNRRADTLMLLEHLPVYTAGRGTRPAHLKSRGASSELASIPIEAVNRGGSVTYHGPGQLVGYPILALSRYAPGAKTYVHMLEEVLIRTLRHWNIHGYRLAKMPGIWVTDQKGVAKIVSIGARIDRGITLHGFALNVMNDLRPFSDIVPCGLDGRRMTSLIEITGAQCNVPVVAECVANEFSAVFGLEWAIKISQDSQTTVADSQPVGAIGDR